VADDLPFRRHLREWIRRNTGPCWEERLLRAGLVCPRWPVEHGGAGLTPARLLILEEECARAGVPRIGRGAGERLVGPAVIEHGTPGQHAALLPRILSGVDRYCVGFAEPDHGSDLAAVETARNVAGGELVLTGRKSWVPGAAAATMIAVLCRTGSAEHACVLVPLEQPGVERRPVRGADGSPAFCEVRLDGARAPLGNVIGGDGLSVAGTMLRLARGPEPAVLLADEAAFWDLVGEARKSGLARDPVVRSELAWVYTRIALLRLGGLDPEVAHLLRDGCRHRFGALATRITGAEALVGPDAFLAGDAIRWGTGEIRRTAVADELLGDHCGHSGTA
jgi:alkylation response protein AidB-like acyl-CoA dehydrogenase